MYLHVPIHLVQRPNEAQPRYEVYAILQPQGVHVTGSHLEEVRQKLREQLTERFANAFTLLNDRIRLASNPPLRSFPLEWTTKEGTIRARGYAYTIGDTTHVSVPGWERPFAFGEARKTPAERTTELIQQRLDRRRPLKLPEWMTEPDVKLRHEVIRVELPDAEINRLPNGDDDETTTGRTDLQQSGFRMSLTQRTAPAHFRETEVHRVRELLFGGDRPRSVVLLGEPGSGRTTVIRDALTLDHAARRAADTPTVEAWQFFPVRAAGGMSVVGSWQQRARRIIEYLSDNGGVLFVDDPWGLVTAFPFATNFATALTEPVRRGALRVVLSATPHVWSLLRAAHPAFADAFQQIRLDPPDAATAQRMVFRRRTDWMRETGTLLSTDLLVELFRLHHRYTPTQPLPGAVAQPLETLVREYSDPTPDDAWTVFKQRTGLSGRLLERERTTEADDLRRFLERQIIGQPAAIDAVTDALALIRQGLTRPNRPFGSFLFLGQTGVGKTHTVRALTEFLTGDPDRMIRFNLNAYKTPYDILRLIGTEEQPDGELPERVRDQPSGVLLLDEIEKADRSIFPLLLQVLDAARLTDHRGRTVDLQHYLIVMTSNLGAAEAERQVSVLQRSVGHYAGVFEKALVRDLPPEFLNRIDQRVIFRPLRREHLLEIARQQIDRLVNREGLQRRTTLLKISDAVLDWIAERGYDPTMGGRALKRVIERDLAVRIAEAISRLVGNRPVLLDIDLAAGDLTVEATPLPTVERKFPRWLRPSADPSKTFRRKLGDLSRRLRTLRERLEEHEEDMGISARIDPATGGTQHHYYLYKSRLDELQEAIGTDLGRTAEQFANRGSLQAFRVRGANPSAVRKPERSKKRTILSDHAFQETARDLHTEQVPVNVSALGSTLTDYHIKVSLLEHQLPAVLANEVQWVTFRIAAETSIPDPGHARDLREDYLQLFDYLHLDARTPPDAPTDILLNGYALRPLLAGELGLFFFDTETANPVPIRTSLAEHGLSRNRIVRRFSTTNQVLDYRTEMQLRARMPARELAVVWWAGV